MDHIKTWTGLSVEESVRMTEDGEKWRKYVHGVANPRIEDGERTEQSICRTLHYACLVLFAYLMQRSHLTKCRKTAKIAGIALESVLSFHPCR